MEEKRKSRSFSSESGRGKGRIEKGEGKMEKVEGRRQKGEGKMEKVEGRRQKAEGKMEKVEGRRQKAEGKMEKGEGRRQKAEGRSVGANPRGRAKIEGEERRGRPKINRDERPSRPRGERSERPSRSYTDRDERPSRPRGERSERPSRSYTDRDERPSRPRGERSERSFRTDGDRKERSFRKDSNREERSFRPNPERAERRFRPKEENERPARPTSRTTRPSHSSPRPAPRKRRDVTAESEILSEIVEIRRREGRTSPKKQKILSLEHDEKYGPVRLNKYISNSGICSRRDADILIQTGAIEVNGQIVTELGMKVMPTDEVRYGDRILQREKPVYLLLNKPKDYITTTDDERDRKDVMELVKGACKERIYPVGRLDKNTTGLLLFTNDGEMTKKLTHPKHGIRKIYYVELEKNLSTADFEKITNGIELSDGEIQVDEIAYTGDTKREIGITLHSGKNRIVRRIFEYLGYEIVKLDRVVFAGLTKKDLPRGKYRFLTEAEINILKMSIQ